MFLFHEKGLPALFSFLHRLYFFDQFISVFLLVCEISSDFAYKEKMVHFNFQQLHVKLHHLA